MELLITEKFSAALLVFALDSTMILHPIHKLIQLSSTAFIAVGLLTGCGGGGSSASITDNSTNATASSDPENLYPLAVGNKWVYQKTHTGAANTLKINEVTGTQSLQGLTAYAMQRTDVSSQSIDFTEYQAKTTQAVVSLLTGSDTFYGETRIQLFPLPLTPGNSSTPLNKTNLSLGDLDGDGRDDTLDIRVDVTVETTETVAVPVGTFTNATRVKTVVRQTAHLSQTGSTINNTVNYTDWYVPNVGLVHNIETGSLPSGDYVDELKLMAYTVGDQKASALHPVIQTSAPVTGGTVIADKWTASLNITLDQPFGSSSDLTLGAQIKNDQGQIYTAKASSSQAAQITLSPDEGLPPGHYTVTLPALKDLVGMPITSIDWTFTIQAATAPDTKAPQVTQTTPDGAAGTRLGLNEAVKFYFDEPLKSSTVNAQNILVKQNGVALDSALLQVTTITDQAIAVNFPKNTSSTYDIQLTAGLTDLAGNPLAAQTFTFQSISTNPASTGASASQVSRLSRSRLMHWLSRTPQAL